MAEADPGAANDPWMLCYAVHAFALAKGGPLSPPACVMEGGRTWACCWYRYLRRVLGILGRGTFSASERAQTREGC